MNVKKIIGNIPANSHYLIVNSQADEILYYLADLKYDNFSLTENDAIYLVKC